MYELKQFFPLNCTFIGLLARDILTAGIKPQRRGVVMKWAHGNDRWQYTKKFLHAVSVRPTAFVLSSLQKNSSDHKSEIIFRVNILRHFKKVKLFQRNTLCLILCQALFWAFVSLGKGK